MEGNFLEKERWVQRYQRNNKRSGLKNLRCFPFCSDTHKVRGFCGRSVTVSLSLASLQNKNDGLGLSLSTSLNAYLFYAEFILFQPHNNSGTNAINASLNGDRIPGVNARTPVVVALGKEKGMVSNTAETCLQPGEVISEEDCLQRERSKENLFNPWFRGIPLSSSIMQQSSSSGAVQVEFNKQKLGWHYSWIANKHTCDSKHVLRVFVLRRMIPQNPHHFQCVAAFDSPTFSIYCRRRQRDSGPEIPGENSKSMKLDDDDSLVSDENEDDDDASTVKPKKKKATPKPSVRRKSSKSDAAAVSEALLSLKQSTSPSKRDNKDDNVPIKSADLHPIKAATPTAWTFKPNSVHSMLPSTPSLPSLAVLNLPNLNNLDENNKSPLAVPAVNSPASKIKPGSKEWKAIQKKTEKMIWRVIRALMQLDFHRDGLSKEITICCKNCDLRKKKGKTAMRPEDYLPGQTMQCQVCNEFFCPNPQIPPTAAEIPDALLHTSAIIADHDIDSSPTLKLEAEEQHFSNYKFKMSKKNHNLGGSFIGSLSDLAEPQMPLQLPIIGQLKSDARKSGHGNGLAYGNEFSSLSDFLDAFLPEISEEDFTFNHSTEVSTLSNSSSGDNREPQNHDDFDDSLNLVDDFGALPFNPSLTSFRNLGMNMNLSLNSLQEQDVSDPVKEISLDAASVLEDLGKFLIEENSLTNAIKKLMSSDDIKNKNFRERKSLILGVFAEQIQIFLFRFGISLEQFDTMLEKHNNGNSNSTSGPNNGNTHPSLKIERGTTGSQLVKEQSLVGSGFGMFGSKKPYRRPPLEAPVSDLPLVEKYRRLCLLRDYITGDWVHDGRISAIHEQIRSDMGLPWLIRKIMSRMEKYFSIEFANISEEGIQKGKASCLTFFQGKLLSTGHLVYVLNGKEHDLNIVSPLPVEKKKKSNPPTNSKRSSDDFLEDVTRSPKNNKKARKDSTAASLPGNEEQGQNQLVATPRGVSYVDYARMELIFFHLYGDSFRTIRRVTGQDEGRTVYTELGYEFLDKETGQWVTRVHYELNAYRHHDVQELEKLP